MSVSLKSLNPLTQYSDCGTIQHVDIFQCVAKFLSYPHIFNCSSVCQLWNTFVNDPHVLGQFFIDEGIPFVESVNGENDYKREFKILYPITISGRMIEQLFFLKTAGLKIAGEIPLMSRQCFEDLLLEDSFEPEDAFGLGKLRKNTFKLLLLPGAFKGTCCPYGMDNDGNLKDPLEQSEGVGQESTITNNIRNLKILCGHPFAIKEEISVFDFFDPKVMEQCNTCSDKVKLVLMRTCIADGSRNMNYPDQEGFVRERGFEVLSLRERLFFNVVCIFTSGTCPDTRKPLIYVRTSNGVSFGGPSCFQAGIGSFALNSGMRVRFTMSTDDTVGVVPCISAEVPQPPALEPLELDKAQ